MSVFCLRMKVGFLLYAKLSRKIKIVEVKEVFQKYDTISLVKIRHALYYRYRYTFGQLR